MLPEFVYFQLLGGVIGAFLFANFYSTMAMLGIYTVLTNIRTPREP